MKSRRILFLLGLISLNLVILCGTFLVTVPQRSMAWSAVSDVSDTHQLILREAYRLLRSDPAYNSGVFPSLDDIMAHEGVTARSGGNGPGPDVDPNSPWSDHFYNPRSNVISKGHAPDAVKREYEKLLKALSILDMNDAAKAAALSAHYLSDMDMPFHVNGVSAVEAQEIYNARGGASSDPAPIILEEKVRGPLTFCYACIFTKTSNPDFRQEIERFLEDSEGNNIIDWFDPWYWNGNWPATNVSSSHVGWEADVKTETIRYTLRGYDTAWYNAAPDFVEQVSIRGGLASEFTRKVAIDSLQKQQETYNNYSLGVQRAIQRVYTLWRSSISALRVSYQPTIMSRKSPVKIKIEAKVTNLAAEDVKNVRVKLTLGNGRIIKGSSIQDVSVSTVATSVVSQ